MGEVGVVMAISVREAMKSAIGFFGFEKGPVELDAPATPERVYRAIAARGGWAAPKAEEQSSERTPIAGAKNPVAERDVKGLSAVGFKVGLAKNPVAERDVKGEGAQLREAVVVSSSKSRAGGEAMPLKRRNSAPKPDSSEKDPKASKESGGMESAEKGQSARSKKGQERRKNRGKNRGKGANVSADQ